MDSHPALAWTDSVKRPLDEARRAIDHFGGEAGHALGDLKDRIGPVQESFEQVVSENPLKAIGLSLAIGVFLGWLIKR